MDNHHLRIVVCSGLVLRGSDKENIIDQAIKHIQDGVTIWTDDVVTFDALRVAIKRLGQSGVDVRFESGMVSKINSKGILEKWCDNSILNMETHFLDELLQE